MRHYCPFFAAEAILDHSLGIRGGRTAQMVIQQRPGVLLAARR
jgi:hypothetical protein